MDIISQLQDQVNTIAQQAFNTLGTVQRDAPPVRLTSNYPEPPAAAADTPAVNLEACSELVDAAKKFDALLSALPVGKMDEEAQLKRIADLQAENELVGQELQRELEEADEELKQARELFEQATDRCLNDLREPFVHDGSIFMRRRPFMN